MAGNPLTTENLERRGVQPVAGALYSNHTITITMGKPKIYSERGSVASKTSSNERKLLLSGP